MYESGHGAAGSHEELRAALRRLEEVLLRHGRELPPPHQDGRDYVLLQAMRRCRAMMQQELSRLRFLLADQG
ncbi:MAG TPA: hypothetical protein VGD76_00730 [Ramlibacter sp.]